MYDEELVVLYSEDNTVYCERQAFALGSSEATLAHCRINRLRKLNFQIIEVRNISEEKIHSLLKRIDLKIEKYKGPLYVNMTINSCDLENVFWDDGLCVIAGALGATEEVEEEIEELFKNPENIDKLKRIKKVPYSNTNDATDTVSTGYMIPIIVYANFFSPEEAKDIFSLKSISNYRNGMTEVHCQFALDHTSEKNLPLVKAAKKAESSDASEEDITAFEKIKESMYSEYINNYMAMQSYVRIKEQLSAAFSKGRKKAFNSTAAF